jgi:hypothetical protein
VPISLCVVSCIFAFAVSYCRQTQLLCAMPTLAGLGAH